MTRVFFCSASNNPSDAVRVMFTLLTQGRPQKRLSVEVSADRSYMHYATIFKKWNWIPVLKSPLIKYRQRNRRSTFFRVPCNEIWENQHNTPPQAASIFTHLATQRNELHHRHLGASQNAWLEFPPSLSNWWLLFFQHKKYTYIHSYIHTWIIMITYQWMQGFFLAGSLWNTRGYLQETSTPTLGSSDTGSTSSEFFLGCQVTMRSVSRTK